MNMPDWARMPAQRRNIASQKAQARARRCHTHGKTKVINRVSYVACQATCQLCCIGTFSVAPAGPHLLPSIAVTKATGEALLQLRTVQI